MDTVSTMQLHPTPVAGPGRGDLDVQVLLSQAGYKTNAHRRLGSDWNLPSSHDVEFNLRGSVAQVHQ